MPETEVLDEITVPLTVRPLEVFQKAPAATHHLEEAAAINQQLEAQRK